MGPFAARLDHYARSPFHADLSRRRVRYDITSRRDYLLDAMVTVHQALSGQSGLCEFKICSRDTPAKSVFLSSAAVDVGKETGDYSSDYYRVWGRSAQGFSASKTPLSRGISSHPNSYSTQSGSGTDKPHYSTNSGLHSPEFLYLSV